MTQIGTLQGFILSYKNKWLNLIRISYFVGVKILIFVICKILIFIYIRILTAILFSTEFVLICI